MGPRGPHTIEPRETSLVGHGLGAGYREKRMRRRISEGEDSVRQQLLESVSSHRPDTGN